MTTLDAILAIEEGSDTIDAIEAVQHLIDKGVVQHLQGSYQRLAARLIAAGVCQWPTRLNEED